MSPDELRKQVEIEFDSLQQTLNELDSLQQDVAEREPTTRELAAAGLFLANLYNGIENVLKRFCRFHEVAIPSGPDSHVELVRLFTGSAQAELPTLLDERLADDLAPYRQFRHVIHHGYGFQLNWADMFPGVAGAGQIVSAVRSAVEKHIAGLPSN